MLDSIVRHCVVWRSHLPVAYFIAVVYKQLLTFYPVVRRSQSGRYGFRAYRRVAALQQLGVRDIQVIGNAAVLFVEQVVVVVKRLQFVAVAHVGA